MSQLAERGTNAEGACQVFLTFYRIAQELRLDHLRQSLGPSARGMVPQPLPSQARHPMHTVHRASVAKVCICFSVRWFLLAVRAPI